jgi:hypothetical protein
VGVCLIGDMNAACRPFDRVPGIWLGEQHVKSKADFKEKFFAAEEGFRGIDVFRHLFGKGGGVSGGGVVIVLICALRVRGE